MKLFDYKKLPLKESTKVESIKKQVVQHKISPFLGAKHLLELFKK
jgi:hypothetical protein